MSVNVPITFHSLHSLRADQDITPQNYVIRGVLATGSPEDIFLVRAAVSGDSSYPTTPVGDVTIGLDTDGYGGVLLDFVPSSTGTWKFSTLVWNGSVSGWIEILPEISITGAVTLPVMSAGRIIWPYCIEAPSGETCDVYGVLSCGDGLSPDSGLLRSLYNSVLGALGTYTIPNTKPVAVTEVAVTGEILITPPANCSEVLVQSSPLVDDPKAIGIDPTGVGTDTAVGIVLLKGGTHIMPLSNITGFYVYPCGSGDDDPNARLEFRVRV